MTRTATCTDGRQRTFTYNGDAGEYLIPYAVTENNKRELFKGFPRMKACVLYTTIVVDSGSRIEMSWGCPKLVYYNNGQVGYQNGQFFATIEEAKRDYEARKQLSAKIGVVGYCDVQLIIK